MILFLLFIAFITTTWALLLRRDRIEAQKQIKLNEEMYEHGLNERKKYLTKYGNKDRFNDGLFEASYGKYRGKHDLKLADWDRENGF